MARKPRDQELRLKHMRVLAALHPPSHFLDLGQFLDTLYVACKEQVGRYSYKEFSNDLGLGMGNSVWLMIRGQRQPSEASLDRIASILHLAAMERRALGLIAQYRNEKRRENQENILEELLACRQVATEDKRAAIELAFYSQWYHAIIFEMIGLDHFSSDPAWIVRHLNAHVEERDVSESLRLLEQLGCIRFDSERGRHVKVVEDFTSSHAVPGVGIIRFHHKMIDLGKESIKTVPHQRREIGAVTVAVNANGVEQIKQEIQRFRSYLMYLVREHQEQADTILQINLQMFPIAEAKESGQAKPEGSDEDAKYTSEGHDPSRYEGG